MAIVENNTAGVHEREEANRTREAGNRDEVEGVGANRRNSFRHGAVGFIDWLDGSTSPHKTPCRHYAAEDTEQDHCCECI